MEKILQRSDDQRLMDCCICQRSLCNPMLLRCLHNCCRICLDKFKSQGLDQVECRICKRCTEVERAQANATIDREVQKSVPDTSDTCSQCEYEECVWCSSCSVSLCEHCLSSHSQFCEPQATRSMQELRHISDGNDTPCQAQCQLHYKPFEFACPSCKDMKCTLCSMDCKANGHIMLLVKDPSSRSYLTECKNRLASLKNDLMDISFIRIPVGMTLSSLGAARKAHLNSIKERKRCILQAVEDICNDLENTVENQYEVLQTEATEVTRRKECLEQNIEDALCYYNKVDRNLLSNNEAWSTRFSEAFLQYEYIENHLKLLSSDLDDIQQKMWPRKAVDIHLMPPNDLHKELRAWIGDPYVQADDCDVAIANKAGCGLMKIPDDVFLRSRLIHTLNLSDNPGIAICDDLCRFRNTIKLLLNNCGLQELPQEIRHLAQLQELHLESNTFSNGLNPGIGKFRLLKILNLKNCALTHLPETIGDLELLEELTVSSNDFSGVVTTAIGRLQRLKKLDLAACRLKEVPDWVGDLVQLEDLSLNSNAFSSGPNPAIGRLRQLRNLALSGCNLTSLPEWIGDMEQLENLSLGSNNFSGGLNPVIGRLHRLVKLDLANCQLSLLPDSIGNLQQLGELYLSVNGFSRGINEALRRLGQLKKLDLRSCDLKSLPYWFGNLQQLEEIHLSGNDLSHGINGALGWLGRLKKLDLRSCDLESLPDWFGDLQQLEELHLSGNDLSRGINGALGRLGRLKTLDLRSCDLKSLPYWFVALQQLEELDLSGNDLSHGINGALGRLGRLKKLDLRSCDLKSLPDWFGDLQQLEELYLSKNDLSGGVNEVLGRLKQLKTLYLGLCHLTNLPDGIGDLQQLEELYLSGNNLSGGINGALGRLGRLKKLNLRSCDLKTLPNWFCDLRQLEELYLSGNDLSGGVNRVLGRLGRLKTLDLGQCHLTSLLDWFGDLQQLSYLDLARNKLVEYPRCTLHLKKLRSLCIIGNCITSLPVELAYTDLDILELYGNPISEPPEDIWTQGIVAIKSYMRAVIPGGEIIHADTLNMIGDTFAGKSSVALSLIAQSPKPTNDIDRTHVLQQLRMAIADNPGHSVVINDFGGHKIYNSVMPIFLPTNGLLILVYNMMDKSHEETVKKWMFTAIAKSKKLRLIIVGTRADLVGDGLQRSALEEQMVRFSSEVLRCATDEVDAHINRINGRSDEKIMSDKLASLCKMRENFQNATVHVVTLSCVVSDGGLRRLYGVVQKLLRPPEILPIRWCRAINDMFDKSLECLYLTMQQVDDICTAHFSDSDDSNARTTILRYLAKSSQIIWLENHPVLQNIIFCSPQKIIDTCKKILHHDKDEQNVPSHYKNELEQYEKGVLLEPLLHWLLSVNANDFSRSRNHAVPECELSEVVVQFLEQFNLISYLTKYDGDRKFIVPCKLATSEPQGLLKLMEMEKTCLNRVTVVLSFTGSVIPMALFETSLCAMLTVAGELSKFLSWPEVWKDGAIILHDGVYFYTQRKDAVIILTAFSQPPNSTPWRILHPILRHLNDNVIALWHGAPPRCAILCPWCFRQKQCSGAASCAAEIELTLTTLVAGDDQSNARPVCLSCAKAIPRCLCFPTKEYGSTNDQNEIDQFFGNLGEQQSQVKLKVHWAVVTDQQAYEALRKSHYELSCKLRCKEITALLFQNGILLESDMNLIEKKEAQSLMDANSYLLDVVRKKGTPGFQQFVDALYATKQGNLYCTVMDTLKTIVPQAFESASAGQAQRT